jgi:hypothetical protein
MITDTPNSIMEWFNDLWYQLSIVEINVYHENGGEFIYYLTNDYNQTKQIIFFQDNKNTIYWQVLKSKIKGNYISVRHVSKFLIENALSIDIPVVVPLPESDNIHARYKIEKALINSSIPASTAAAGTNFDLAYKSLNNSK